MAGLLKEVGFLQPAKFERGEAMYSVDDVRKAIIGEVSAGTHIPRREKDMAEKIDTASDEIEDATKRFSRVLADMMGAESKVTEHAKRTSGNVRKAADDLASGLLKVQKTADFANLERHVALLERAAAAMTTLAALDKDGKLEKLVKAMK